jgi:hypothetical protein
VPYRVFAGVTEWELLEYPFVINLPIEVVERDVLKFATRKTGLMKTVFYVIANKKIKHSNGRLTIK